MTVWKCIFNSILKNALARGTPGYCKWYPRGTPVGNHCYRMTKCYCNKYFVSKFVFLGHRVHFDKVFIGQVIYKTAWQIPVGIRQFTKQSVSDYLEQAILWNRVSESHWDNLLLLTENKSNFIFRVKTHAENDGRLAVWFSALNNIPPESGHAVSQSFQFYFCCLTMVGSTTEGKWGRQERTSPFRWC